MLSNTSFTVIDDVSLDSWSAAILLFHDLGPFQRLIIEANGSRLDILCGECSSYRWVFLPDFEVGCTQAAADDLFWNTEHLQRILNRKDTLTVVHGISFVLSGGLSHD